MTNAELKMLLQAHTNMSNRDIDRHIRDGIMVYSNNESGYNEFKADRLANLFDEEDIAPDWDRLDIVGDYRLEFIL